MCDLYSKCKNNSEFKVIHKAVGLRKARIVKSCKICAGKVGVMVKGQPALIDQPGMDSKFYKIERLA